MNQAGQELPRNLGSGPPPGSLGRVLRNSTINLAAIGLSAFCNLATLFMLTRALGKEGYGQYSIFFTLIVVVQFVLEFGISTILTWRIAQAPTAWRETLAEGLGLLVLVGSISILVLLGMGVGFAVGKQHGMLLVYFASAAVASTALQVQQFCAAVFRAFERFEYDSLAKIIQALSLALLIFLFVSSDRGGLTAALAILALSQTAAAAFLIGNLHWNWQGLGWRLNGAIMKKWFSLAAPVGLGDVLRRLGVEADNLLLYAFQPRWVVGIYTTAFRPLMLLNYVPQVVQSALFPSFTRHAEKDGDTLGRLFSRTLRLLWIINLPLVIGISFSAEVIVTFLAGEGFLEATLPMRILVWSTSFYFMTLPFRYVFTALGKQRTYTRLVLVVFVVEAGLETALVPRWSYYGTSVGTLIGEGLFTVMGLILCQRQGLVKHLRWSGLLRAVLAGSAMAAVLWIARRQLGHDLVIPTEFGEAHLTMFAAVNLPWFALALVGGTGLYFLLCVVLGAVEREEANRLLGVVRGTLGRWRHRSQASQPLSSTSTDSASGILLFRKETHDC